jgi:hypothetical protein
MILIDFFIINDFGVRPNQVTPYPSECQWLDDESIP